MPSAKKDLFDSIVNIITNYNNNLDKNLINNIINSGINDILEAQSKSAGSSLELNEDLNIARGDLLNQLKNNGADFDHSAYNNVLNQYLNIKNTRNLTQSNKPKEPQSFDLVAEDLDEESNYLSNNKLVNLSRVKSDSPKVINSKPPDTYAEPNKAKEPELISDDLTTKDLTEEQPIVNLGSPKHADAKIIEPAPPELTDKKPKEHKPKKPKKIKTKKSKDAAQKDAAQITQELINLIEEASQLAHVDENLPKEQFVKTLQENLIKISNDLSHKISSYFR
jgi:hypothetical protein